MKTADAIVTWQAASLLVGYPDQQLLGTRPLLRSLAGSLPAPAARPLGRFLDHLDATSPATLEASYVDTFDHKRRCCLYLTYYAYGDTRKRGMALLRIKQAYRAAGLELRADELPDHLAVVLEFAATGDAEGGRRLLLEHRAGLEVLRLALTDTGSPYADVLARGLLDAAAAGRRRPGRRRPAGRPGAAGGGGRAAAVRSARVHAVVGRPPMTTALAADAPPAAEVGAADTLLWVVIPYVCLAVFVVGHWWRYRYDKFGWTTRSSQLYERRLLRWGSPLFHFGILFVLLGHVFGLGVPKRWTEAVGVSTASTTRSPSGSAPWPGSARSPGWRC